ncbi:MAG: helix-turn-helix domain-containing protein [Clostridia bacterium]|nr:helix-turn-helix domain-containing protein [Clostridia bacterium]
MGTFSYINNELTYIANENNEGGAYTFENIAKAFADGLKGLRELYSLSGNALSNILGIPQQTLNLYEQNKRTPNFITAMQIASSFGLTLDNMILYGLDLLNIDIEEISHYPTLLPR